MRNREMKPWKMRIIFIVFGGNDFHEDIYIMQMLCRYTRYTVKKMDFDGLTHEVDAPSNVHEFMKNYKFLDANANNFKTKRTIFHDIIQNIFSSIQLCVV